MVNGYKTSTPVPALAELYGKVSQDIRLAIAGGYAPEPAPLDVSNPETFDGWVMCADGRTLWEYASAGGR